ncbi:MAG: hypothetical protein ACHQ2Y_10455, partial [Candidatus Lutacidiplasmatales archaeon]
MSASTVAQAILFALFGALTAVLNAVVGPTYDGLVVPELQPSALFPPLPPDPGSTTFVSRAAEFSAYLLTNLVDPAIALLALGVGLLYLLRSVLPSAKLRPEGLVTRLVVSVILANFSVPIAGAVLGLAGAAYPVVADFDGGAWESWGNIVPPGALTFSWDNGALAFVVAFSLFSLVLLLAIAIALRDALLGVLIVLLPVLTLLWPIPSLAPLAKRAWKLFAEAAFLPLVTVIPLELAVGTPSILLVLGYLTVALAAPYFLSLAGGQLSGAGFP